jgi:hypothetical protein
MEEGKKLYMDFMTLVSDVHLLMCVYLIQVFLH